MTARLINSATTASVTAAPSAALNMPASIAPGRLLLACVHYAPNQALSGWTPIAGATATYRQGIWGKVAAGGDTITMTGSSLAYAAVIGQYDNWSGNLADIVASVISGTDSPLLTPGASKDWLWVATRSDILTGTGAITTAPSSYGDLVVAANASGGTSITLATADRALAATSEDPGPFTNTGTTNIPFAATIAIPPARPGAFLPFFA